MIRFILPLLGLCSSLFAGTTLHRDAAGDTVKFSIATALLKDGTRIWGMLETESSDTVVINDFNAGPLSLARSSIREIEITPVDGKVMIETVNGTIYYGEIVGMTGGVLMIRSDLIGVFPIQANTISKISVSAAYVSRKGGTWFTNPNATRYFFAPSAIPLKKKEGYFQNAYLLANSVNVGITDNVTVGGGIVIPLLFYVTPKISFRASKNFYLGGGVLFTQSFIKDFDLSAGIVYGLATYGNYEHNVTLGSGYGFASFNTEYKTTPMPIVTINGMTRVAKKVSLVTENWLIPRGGYNKEVSTITPAGEVMMETVYEKKNFYSGAASFGLRFMPGTRTSVDFSVVGILTDPGQGNLVLPYLDFVYKFN
ncbi:MAG TPA: hypothetical protein VFU15_11490 [Bacteroidia bacterium]|nr:hypothetical protein [Bacteroidia bacterium]